VNQWTDQVALLVVIHQRGTEQVRSTVAGSVVTVTEAARRNKLFSPSLDSGWVGRLSGK
jgi:hypothetical protein